MRKIGIIAHIGLAGALLEASGPVQVKKTREELEAEWATRQTESEKRHQQRVAAAKARAQLIYDRTPESEWARISKAEKRRAEKKAAKKQAKKQQK